MVTKVGLYICPVPGCPIIARGKDGYCPKHPEKQLTREVYEHRPKIPAHSYDYLKSSIDDIFINLFGIKKGS